VLCSLFDEVQRAMKQSKCIPRNLHWAFEEGRRVRTPGGIGLTTRRRLADLVLPTGEISIGYPGSQYVNVPSEVHPIVDAGTYPVFITLANHRRGYKGMAFVTVCFTSERPTKWESAGHFFTDSGTGCIYDRSLTALLEQDNRVTDGKARVEAWDRAKYGVLNDGDGNWPLDGHTGANIILFKTYDWSYDCFLGRHASGHPACLLIDGRWLRWWEHKLRAWLW
jgi:hypothetical protein